MIRAASVEEIDRQPITGRLASQALSLGALVLLGVAAATVIAYLGRERTFFYDEWQLVLYRRLDGADAYLTQYNGHLPAVPVFVYRSLMGAVGLAPYGAYRAFGIGVHLLCAGALFVYARRRVPPFIAVAAAALLLFLGRGWEVLLWPMNAFFFEIPLLALIAALLLLDRGNLGRDVGAGIAVAVALGSSALGIPIAVGVALELGWTRWRRLWVVGIPSALWGLWALTLKSSVPLVDDALRIPGATAGDVTGGAGAAPSIATILARLPGYVGHEVAAAFGGVFGARPRVGVGIGVVALVLLGSKLLQDRRPPPRLITIGTVAAVFWISTALTRSQVAQPQSSRYTYVGGVLILLFAAEAARGLRFGPLWMGALAVVTAVGIAFGVQQLGLEGRVLRDHSQVVRAELAAVERNRATIDPALRPDPVRMPGVAAGPYLAAVGALGSPVTDRERPVETPRAGRRSGPR